MADGDRPTQPLPHINGDANGAAKVKPSGPIRSTKTFEQRLAEITAQQDESLARANAVVSRGEAEVGRLKNLDPKKTRFCIETYNEVVQDTESKKITVKLTTTESQIEPEDPAKHPDSGPVVRTTSYSKVLVRKGQRPSEGERKAAV